MKLDLFSKPEVEWAHQKGKTKYYHEHQSTGKWKEDEEEKDHWNHKRKNLK